MTSLEGRGQPRLQRFADQQVGAACVRPRASIATEDDAALLVPELADRRLDRAVIDAEGGDSDAVLGSSDTAPSGGLWVKLAT